MYKKIEIKSDVFNICNRVKKIDKGYYILFNLDKRHYELHNKNQKGNSYCLTFYGNLDNRLLNKIFESDIKNEKNIFEQIEKENKKLNQREENKRKDINEYKLKEIFDYSKNNSKNVKGEKMFSSHWL